LVVAGFLAAGAVRLVWLWAFRDNWDMGTYRQFAEFAPRGGGLYRDIVSYHFSPVFAFLLAGVAGIAPGIGMSFERGVGLVLLAADAISALLVYRIARGNLGRPPLPAAIAALLFFSNPVSVFVTGFHLQFDNLAILFLLGAIALARPEKNPLRPSVLALLSGSLLVKHVTWFHPLLFARGRLGWRKSIALAVPYLVFFAVSFLPYWNVLGVTAKRIFGYASLGEDYGTAMLTKVPGMPSWAPAAVFLLAIAIAVFAFRRMEIGRACLLLFLVILIFVPGVTEYYFVWPIALGSLYGGAGYALFTLLVSAFFLGSPDGLGLPIPHLPGWHGIWWGAVFWLLWELRRSSGTRPKAEARP
jgi:hypothetical protein